MANSIKINVKNTHSRFVALALNSSGKVLAEGLTPKSVTEKAKKTGKDFSLMYVPQSGQTHIY
jgi:hypothetical protein